MPLTEQTWTVQSILEWMEGYLRQKGDAQARLSAQWLLASVLQCSRLQLYADLQRPLMANERDVLRSYTKRRAAGEPLQYITGTTDFRFLTLQVAPGVLIPRPETEVLVSEAMQALKAVCETNGEEEAGPEPGIEPEPEPGIEPEPEPEPLLVVDVCTGSGNIALALASELGNAFVYATDISPEACALAAQNIAACGLGKQVEVLQCDLCTGLPATAQGKVDLLISNPPYIPTALLSALSPEVASYEPMLALDGGQDGLDVFRRILGSVADVLRPGGILAVELHETALEAAAALAQQHGLANIHIANDLAERPRVLIARLSE